MCVHTHKHQLHGMLVYTPQLHAFLGLSAQSRHMHCQCTICTSYLLIVKSSCSPTRPLSSYPRLSCLYIVLENQLTSKCLQLTHLFIHPLRQRCVCFVQWRQKQQPNTIAQPHPCSSNTNRRLQFSHFLFSSSSALISEDVLPATAVFLNLFTCAHV